MGMKDDKLVPFVQEMTLNTYTCFDGFEAAGANTYWAQTKDYWAAVCAVWDAVIKRDGMIAVPELVKTGSTSGERLMSYADEIEEEQLTTLEAVI